MTQDDVAQVEKLYADLKNLIRTFATDNAEKLLIRSIKIDQDSMEIEVCNTDFLQVKGGEVSHIIHFDNNWM